MTISFPANWKHRASAFAAVGFVAAILSAKVLLASGPSYAQQHFWLAVGCVFVWPLSVAYQAYLGEAIPQLRDAQSWMFAMWFAVANGVLYAVLGTLWAMRVSGRVLGRWLVSLAIGLWIALLAFAAFMSMLFSAIA